MRNTECILEDHENPDGAPHRWIFRTHEVISVKFAAANSQVCGKPFILVKNWQGERSAEIPVEITYQGNQLSMTAEFSLPEAYYLYQPVLRNGEQIIALCSPRFLVVSNTIPRALADIHLRQQECLEEKSDLSIKESRNRAPTSFDSGLVYSIILDRFAIGNGKRNRSIDEQFLRPNCPFGRHGGDLKGLLERLPYLKGLGVTSILLNPIYLNENLLYHGYHPLNLFMVDPLIGTAADLRHLVDVAHSMGMKVIFDAVCNHLGDLIDWTAHPPDFKYFAHQADHNGRTWTPRLMQRRENAFSTASLLPYPEEARTVKKFHGMAYQNDPLRCRLFELLEDWCTEDESVRELLITHVKFLISEFDFDGVRYDAVRHVEPGFWSKCLSEVDEYAKSLGKADFVQIAEHASTSEAEYLDWRKSGFRSMLQFPLNGYLRSHLKEGSIDRFVNYLCGTEWRIKTGAQVTDYLFLDSHDQTRLLNDVSAAFGAEAKAVFHICLATLLLGRLRPIVYYGTEQDFDGALGDFWDPSRQTPIAEDCYVREDMFRNEDCLWLGGELNNPKHEPYSTVCPTYLLISWLAHTRKTVDVHEPDFLQSTNHELSGVAFRILDGAGMLAVVINSSSSQQDGRLSRTPTNVIGAQAVNAPFINSGTARFTDNAISCSIQPYGVIVLHLQCGASNVH